MSEEKQLTAHQKDMLPVYRDKWIAIGLDNSSLRQEQAANAVIKLYENAGLTPPKNIEFFQSPKQMLDRLKSLDYYKGKSTGELLNMFVFGQYDAAWLAYYDYLQQEILNEPPGKLEGLILTAQECGWIVPMEGHCYICEKPQTLRYNAEGQLHSEKRPAFEYSDGWGAAVVWGQQIPLKWLTEPPSASELLAWPNTDQRQAGCALIGWDNILKELDSVLIDEHEDPQMGQLLRVRMSDPEDNSETSEELFARFQCGTGRWFAQLVTDSNAETVQAAQNWMHNAPPGVDYRPAFRQ